MREKIQQPQNKDGLHDLGLDGLLSRLSDDILVSIPSRLPIKCAAATGVLSRRWRHLWCRTVRLDFDDMERWKEIRYLGCCWNRLDLAEAERSKYVSWVNRVIRQHKSPAIDEFKICYGLDVISTGAIDEWIEFAISKNVQRLELDLEGGLYSKGNYAFPIEIFATKCELSLEPSFFNVPVRPNAIVKSLKALVLKHVDVNDEGLRKILSNCPVLEHLLINESCNLVNAKIHGKGLALKTFEIIYCDGLKSIEICDSNVLSFNCSGLGSISYRLKNLEKLEKISICDYEMKINLMFFQISCNIPYLQVLELRFNGAQEDMLVSMCPKLLKLKQLRVVVDDGNSSLLTSMVEACPNLQRFALQLRRKSSTYGLKNRQAAKQPHQRLEVVEIDGYHELTNDLELAMYFIRNCVALKKLVIKPYIEVGLAAKEMMAEKNTVRYRTQQQLESKTPVGVELVIL